MKEKPRSIYKVEYPSHIEGLKGPSAGYKPGNLENFELLTT